MELVLAEYRKGGNAVGRQIEAPQEITAKVKKLMRKK